MSSLIGKLVSQTEVTSDPDVFFDIFAHKPYLLVSAVPEIFQSMDLIDGVLGTLGCIISGKYVATDGQVKTANALLVAIDEINKSATYQVIAGGLLDLFTTFRFTLQASTQAGKNIVTWTFEYVKLLPTNPDPTSLMNIVTTATKEFDAKNLK